MEYKRLGDYIREVNVHNLDLKVTNLLGVSISKEFMPSIANTIGTDMSTYKIVERRQFAYGPVTSRNGDKVSIALLDGYDDAIISQAYTVFEVIDHKQLLPEYLMMWFRRPEFDRYARFHSHGSAREIFDWEELCDVMLPVPSITRQREIVSEYETLTNRICLNNQMIQNLEATAQALYRKTFVDNIDKENLPEGWRMGTLGEVASFKYGKLAEKHVRSNEFPYPVFSGYAVTGYTDKYTLKEPTIVIIARGDAGTGRICMSPKECFLSNLAIAIETKDVSIKDYLYYHLQDSDTMSLRSGSAQAQITINNVEPFEIMIPLKDVYVDFSQKVETLYNTILIYSQENSKLTELQSLLLSKMGQ
ncbi:MAG: restriction endonuclease subunit S [Prevotella sp.]|nr:restriction endonuclease subunit S [Prevotella sp.]